MQACYLIVIFAWVYKTKFLICRTQNSCSVWVYPDGVSVYPFGYIHHLGGVYYIPRPSHSRRLSPSQAFGSAVSLLWVVSRRKNNSQLFLLVRVKLCRRIQFFIILRMVYYIPRSSHSREPSSSQVCDSTRSLLWSVSRRKNNTQLFLLAHI